MFMSKKAFSLLELLLTLSVLAVLLSLLLPSISSVTSAATEKRDLLNAKMIASTYNGAVASGITFSNSNKEITGLLIKGVTSPGGITFRVILSQEQASRCSYLIRQTPSGEMYVIKP